MTQISLCPVRLLTKEDLALGDAGDAAAQAEDDFVRKLVGDHADRIGGCVVVVLLAQNLRVDVGALDVVQPTLHLHLVGGHAQVAEGEHRGVWRRREFQSVALDFGRLSGNLHRVEALRNHIEDAGIVEIVPERVVESLEQVGVLGIWRRRFEVGRGETDLFDAKTGAGADPVLGEAVAASQKQKCESGRATAFDNGQVAQCLLPVLRPCGAHRSVIPMACAVGCNLAPLRRLVDATTTNYLL